MSVTDTAAALTRSREPFVQATVVRAQKPTSAHAGDTALVRADGSIDGFVGGTCAEASVREYGLMTLSTNEPLLLRIVPGEVRPAERRGGRGHRRQPVPVRAARWRSSWSRGCRRPGCWSSATARSPRRWPTSAGRSGFDVQLVAGEQAAPAAGDAALVVASHGRGEEPALHRGAAARRAVRRAGRQPDPRRRGAGLARRPRRAAQPGAQPGRAGHRRRGRRRRSRCRCSPSWSPSGGPPNATPRRPRPCRRAASTRSAA